MKSLKEIIQQNPVYLHNWEKKADVLYDFDIHTAEEINILFASYGTDNWEGYAFVLFEQDGKLYEINGSHCSCYGLEGQWDAEEVVLLELENRLTKGDFGDDDYSGNQFKKELCEFLGINN